MGAWGVYESSSSQQQGQQWIAPSWMEGSGITEIEINQLALDYGGRNAQKSWIVLTMRTVCKRGSCTGAMGAEEPSRCAMA